MLFLALTLCFVPMLHFRTHGCRAMERKENAFQFVFLVGTITRFERVILIPYTHGDVKVALAPSSQQTSGLHIEWKSTPNPLMITKVQMHLNVKWVLAPINENAEHGIALIHISVQSTLNLCQCFLFHTLYIFLSLFLFLFLYSSKWRTQDKKKNYFSCFFTWKGKKWKKVLCEHKLVSFDKLQNTVIFSWSKSSRVHKINDLFLFAAVSERKYMNM